MRAYKVLRAFLLAGTGLESCVSHMILLFIIDPRIPRFYLRGVFGGIILLRGVNFMSKTHASMRRIECLYPGEKQFCPYRLDDSSCKMTCHHLYYPRRDYKTPFLSKWRNSVHHKVMICAGLHQTLHLSISLPKKPYTHHIEEVDYDGEDV